MSIYRRIETTTLSDRKVSELSRPMPNGQSLWIYLLTGQRTTIFPGLVSAREVLIADDLGWPIDAPPAPNECRSLRDAWSEIESRGMAIADWRTGVIVLPRALLDRRGTPRETARPSSPNHFRGWMKGWTSAPDCELKAWYLAELGRFAEALDRDVRAKKDAQYRSAFTEAFAASIERTREAFPKAYESSLASLREGLISKRERHVNEYPKPSGSNPEPTRVPETETESGIGDLSELSPSEASSVPDPSNGRRLDHDPEAAPIAQPSDDRQRLQLALFTLHQTTFQAIRDELGMADKVPAMRPAGMSDGAERALRELMIARGWGEDFAARARHAIAIQADNARRKRTLMYFGAGMWRDDNFDRVQTMALGEARATPRTGRFEPMPPSSYPDGEVDL